MATFALCASHGDVAARMRWACCSSRRRSRRWRGLLVVAAITPTFLYFAGLARTRASVATFAEMAQTFASLLITWGVMGEALRPHQLVAGVVLLVAVGFINRAVDARRSRRAPRPCSRRRRLARRRIMGGT